MESKNIPEANYAIDCAISIKMYLKCPYNVFIDVLILYGWHPVGRWFIKVSQIKYHKSLKRRLSLMLRAIDRRFKI